MSRMHSEDEILQSVMNLPKGVEETYDQALDRIRDQNDGDKELAKRILSWISLASRPLFIQELQCGLSVIRGMRELQAKNIIFESKLTSVCAGLVVIDEDSPIVRLVRAYPAIIWSYMYLIH
jgi:hypothetical protein